MSESDYILLATVDSRNRRTRKHFKKRLNFKEVVIRNNHKLKRYQQKHSEVQNLEAEFAQVTEQYKSLLLRRKEQQEAFQKKKELEAQDLGQYKIKTIEALSIVRPAPTSTRPLLLAYLKNKLC